MSKDEFVVEMLTLQFISGKNTGSAAEYVELYKETRKQILSAMKENFDVRNLL